MSDYVVPAWIDEIWDEAREANSTEDEWSRALGYGLGLSVTDIMARRSRWVGALGTTTYMTVSAMLIVWWWRKTGETRDPLPSEVQELAERKH